MDGLAPAFGIVRHASAPAGDEPARSIVRRATSRRRPPPDRAGCSRRCPGAGTSSSARTSPTSTVEPGEAAPPAGAVEAFLEDVNATFPRLKATPRGHPARPSRTHAGRGAEREGRPAAGTGSDASGRRGRGVISLIGVKFTTARSAAERAVDEACAELTGRFRRSRTAATPLPHADIADVEGRLDRDAAGARSRTGSRRHGALTSWYGTEASDVVRYGAKADLLDRLSPETPVLSAEMAYAVEHAQARRLPTPCSGARRSDRRAIRDARRSIVPRRSMGEGWGGAGSSARQR